MAPFDLEVKIYDYSKKKAKILFILSNCILHWKSNIHLANTKTIKQINKMFWKHLLMLILGQWKNTKNNYSKQNIINPNICKTLK